MTAGTRGRPFIERIGMQQTLTSTSPTGIKKMRVMSVPRRMPSMAGFDLEVTGYMEPPQSSSSVRGKT